MVLPKAKTYLIKCIACFGMLFFSGIIKAQYLNIDSCLQVLKTSKEDTNKVILLGSIAWNISYQNLQEGIDYAEKGISLAEKLAYEEKYAYLFNVIGSIYADMSDRAKALDFFLKGLTYAKKYGQYSEMGHIYNSLGNFYAAQGDAKKAISYYLQSVEAHKKAHSEKPLYTPYNNLGGMYIKLGKVDSAIYYMDLCTNYNLKNHNKSSLIHNYITLSEIYTNTGNKEKALDYATNSVELARQLGDNYTLSHALIQYGSALYMNHKTDETIAVLNESSALAERTGDVSTLQSNTVFLSHVYEELGDYKNSLKYFKKYKLYKDSTLNMESIQQIKNAEARYENEKKQAEIELLSEKQKLDATEGEKKKVYLYVAFAGILTLAVVLIVLYRNNRLKQKTNKNLENFNKEVQHQKELVEVKNKEITDSINYAKRIQQSILTSDSYFEKHTNDFFILFKPKDIVSGDFYWGLEYESKFLLMTADCTGHGVPGAMMSMMGINFLNEIVNERKISSPAKILNHLRTDIIKSLNQENTTQESKDGMDCCFCSFDLEQMKLRYANANNNFYVIRGNELLISKSNKMPVGAGHSDDPFEEFEMDLEKGDLVITLTDGYADQFGGAKGKKYKYKQLEELLLSNAHLSLESVKKVLDDSIEQWRGNLEQVDDICIIGIKI